MLIKERLLNCDFSNSENVIIEYILKEKSHIKNMTTKDIAEATYTSPSTLIRIAHKMGFNGWNELKDAYLKEDEYLTTHFTDIDANYPFTKEDNIMSIASKLAKLKEEAIEDTKSLMTHDDLQKAVRIIQDASMVQMFAVSNNIHNSRMFQHNMRRINKRCDICETQGDILFSAVTMDHHGCAIITSYSGETPMLVKVAQALKTNHIPIIAITNIGDNTIASLSDVVLRISTREKLYSKIATYTTDAAILYVLDVLYSCVFALNYEHNLKTKEINSKAIETGRYSTLNILKEED